MRKIDGKWIIGMVFSNREDAERFEQAIQGDDGEEVLDALREVEEYSENFLARSNSINGPVTGSVIQANNISGGLNLGGH